MPSFLDYQVLYSDGAPAAPIRLGQLLVDESELVPLDMLKICTDLSPVVYTSLSDGIVASILASNNVWTGTNEFDNTTNFDGAVDIDGALDVSSAATFSGSLDITGTLLMDGSAGTSGYVLTSSGPGVTPVWSVAASSGYPEALGYAGMF